MASGAEPRLYDRIGGRYAAARRTDPRWMTRIDAALGQSASVLNVGAGTGSYEPPRPLVVAIEPSQVMLEQRPAGAAPGIRGVAEHLPFPEASFDAVLGVHTVHHWNDQRRGIAEARRVARDKIVIVTTDAEMMGRFWLHDYFPAFTAVDLSSMPQLEELAAWLGGAHVEALPVPHDCIDGFCGAYWRRPHMYLDAEVRGGISSFARIDDAALSRGLERLSADLASGAWHDRYAAIRSLDEVDLGYRLVAGPLSA